MQREKRKVYYYLVNGKGNTSIKSLEELTLEICLENKCVCLDLLQLFEYPKCFFFLKQNATLDCSLYTFSFQTNNTNGCLA